MAEEQTAEPSSNVLVLNEPGENVVLQEPEATPAVDAPTLEAVPSLDAAMRRRKVKVPKRRPPGDRLTPAVTRSAAVWRSRSYFPPRREIPTS